MQISTSQVLRRQIWFGFHVIMYMVSSIQFSSIQFNSIRYPLSYDFLPSTSIGLTVRTKIRLSDVSCVFYLIAVSQNIRSNMVEGGGHWPLLQGV
jgi:hypothetical protein